MESSFSNKIASRNSCQPFLWEDDKRIYKGTLFALISCRLWSEHYKYYFLRPLSARENCSSLCYYVGIKPKFMLS